MRLQYNYKKSINSKLPQFSVNVDVIFYSYMIDLTKANYVVSGVKLVRNFLPHFRAFKLKIKA